MTSPLQSLRTSLIASVKKDASVTDLQQVIRDHISRIDVLIKESHPQKSQDQKWVVKYDVIKFTKNEPLIPLGTKGEVLTSIIMNALPACTDPATAAFCAKYDRLNGGRSQFDKALQPYGIVRYFYDHVITEFPPESYKTVREAKVNKQIEQARLMLQVDKRDPKTIKDVIDFMYDEGSDGFWRTTIMSMAGFRKNFDQIMKKMEVVESKQEKKGDGFRMFKNETHTNQ